MTFKEFGNQVSIYRFQQRQNLRNAAVDADVTKATLHRIEHGRMSQADNFLKVCYWAGINPADVEPENMK